MAPTLPRHQRAHLHLTHLLQAPRSRGYWEPVRVSRAGASLVILERASPDCHPHVPPSIIQAHHPLLELVYTSQGEPTVTAEDFCEHSCFYQSRWEYLHQWNRQTLRTRAASSSPAFEHFAAHRWVLPVPRRLACFPEGLEQTEGITIRKTRVTCSLPGTRGSASQDSPLTLSQAWLATHLSQECSIRSPLRPQAHIL